MKRMTCATLLTLVAATTAGAASNIDATNRYAYSANAGWLDFRANTNNGLFINDQVCSGYVYCANAGWISLGDGTPTNGLRYGNDSAADYGVNVYASNLVGYAYSANTGWLNFETNYGRPRVNRQTGIFSGYAWSQNLGWIGLSNSQAYVQTAYPFSAVVLYEFYLSEAEDGIQACWRTASESETLGFDLFREQDGQWVKVNPAMIPAQGWPSGGIGADYCVEDPTAQPDTAYRYQLVEYELTGEQQVYGPFARSTRTLRTAAIAATAQGMAIRWLSRTDEKYSVYKATDLRGAYELLAEGIPATDPENVYVDTTATDSAAYYRITLTPTPAP